ncbi:hypothetical protein D4R20_02610 [bacterium]|nr:MAG: hypothetical protein D4R20_02610 [bacterium]
MKIKIIRALTLISGIFILNITLQAQTAGSHNYSFDLKDRQNYSDGNNHKILDLKYKVLGIERKNSPFDTTSPNEKYMKSPYIGAALSGLVPGAGQFYAKKYVKSGIFLAVEAGLWITYAIFQNKFHNQTDFFQNYADANWDVHRYAQWLVSQNFTGSNVINPNEQNINILRQQLNQCEEQNFSHTLPIPGEQQYYEVIGKYQNFIYGWSGAFGLPITKNNYADYHIGQVDYYMTERQKANDYYNNGTLTLTGVIVNHIISAADAVFSVISYNNGISVKPSVNVGSYYSYKARSQVLIPQVNLLVSF